MKKLLSLLCVCCFVAGCDDSDSKDNSPSENSGNIACEDECNVKSECINKHGMRLCKDANHDGCKEWLPEQVCEEDEECVEGECQIVSHDDKNDKGNPDNIDKCPDACQIGQECVDDTHFHICAVPNDETCPVWSEAKPCPENQICEKGKCNASEDEHPCTDACTLGDEKCIDDTHFQVCTSQDDSCAYWSDIQECPENQKCAGGKCQPQENNACASTCESEGLKQCSENMLQNCTDANQDGCLEWVDEKSCPNGCDLNDCKEDVPECKDGICPIVITDFSQVIKGDTSKSKNVISTYQCSDFDKTEIKNESGPEEYYAVKLDEPGYLIAGITDGDKVDVDVHILSALDGDHCLARNNYGAGARVDAGMYYISVDTFNGAGNAGEYSLKVTFIPDSGVCGMRSNYDITRENGCSTIHMPVTGPAAKEDHLVTEHDWELNGNKWWPSSRTEHVAEHKQYTDQLFGNGTSAGNQWCPAEGGGTIGQGSREDPVPAEAEAWYINMFWTNKSIPAKGTKFLVVEPRTGKTVVAAAGYETGPGDCYCIGGAVHEINHYFGTDHESIMVFGEMIDQSPDYGPFNCFE